MSSEKSSACFASYFCFLIFLFFFLNYLLHLACIHSSITADAINDANTTGATKSNAKKSNFPPVQPLTFHSSQFTVHTVALKVEHHKKVQSKNLTLHSNPAQQMDRLFQKARSELRAIAEEHLPSSTELRSAITTSFKEMAKLTIDAAEDLPERLLEVQTVTSDTYRRVVHPMAKALASRITVRGRYKLQLLLGVTLIVQSVMLALGNGMALNYSAPVNMPGLPPILPDLAMLSAPLYVLKYG